MKNLTELSKMDMIIQGVVEFGGILIFAVSRINPFYERNLGIALAQEGALKRLYRLEELKACLEKSFSNSFLNKPCFGEFLGGQLDVLGHHLETDGDLFFKNMISKIESLDKREIDEIEGCKSEKIAKELLKKHLIKE